MEDYKNYIRHKSLESLIGTVFIVFAVVFMFLVGKSLSPENLYKESSQLSLVQN